MLLELQGPLHPTLWKSQLPSVCTSSSLHPTSKLSVLEPPEFPQPSPSLMFHPITIPDNVSLHLPPLWNLKSTPCVLCCTWPRSLRCSCRSCHRLPQTPAPFISPPQLPSPPLVLSHLPIHTRTHASSCQILSSSFLQPLWSSHHAQLQTHWIVCILHSLLPFGNNHKKYRLAKPGINSWVLIVPFSTVVISRLGCFSRFFYPTAFSSLSACGLTFFWGKIKACFNDHYLTFPSFPGGTSGKEHTCQYRRRKRCDLDPCVGKIPRRKVWQPTPVFLSGECHGQRSLAGCSPWGHRHNWSNLACKTYLPTWKAVIFMYFY